MKSLAEQYRPRTLDDVIAQEKAVKQIRTLERRGLGGRALWITGQSGTGKTTIGRIIAESVADDFNVEEIDGSELSAEQVRAWKKESAYKAIGEKGGRAFIVNEAHRLRADTITKLLVILEEIPDHVTWIFTTTNDGQDTLFDNQLDANPLLSRCARIGLTRQGLAKPFAERAQEIARAEGLDGKPLKSYVDLLQKCRNNLRDALNRIEAGEMML